MVDEKKSQKIEADFLAYILGILAIIFAFANSFAGLILGLVGLYWTKKSSSPLSKKAKKLNIWGIIISIIIIAVAIALNLYLYLGGTALPQF